MTHHPSWDRDLADCEPARVDYLLTAITEGRASISGVSQNLGVSAIEVEQALQTRGFKPGDIKA